VTIPRDGNYVWITALSKLMSGDLQCTWSAWFKSHYSDWPHMPDTFELTKWKVDHNALLVELVQERRALGERVYRETQNKFQVRLSDTITLEVRPTSRFFDTRRSRPNFL